ncbi:MAG: DUF1385 domain-containing protein [Actinomycetota bacterium]|nr:DUF1385 domain-containing protein [Actinomycetota bacterium]
MPSKPTIGGQAVMEGVMMRGPKSWAVAVRKPDGEIVVESHPLPGHAERHKWMKWPFLRGVWVLVESLMIGMRALKISASYALEEEEAQAPETEKTLNWSLGVGFVLISALFIAVPALISKWGGVRIGVESDLWQNVLEGFIRIGIFLGYVLLISLIPDIRRVFQYHGAEHKTIYAYENDDPLEPRVIDRYSTLHVRCGTNFLFIVMFLAIVGHFVADIILQGTPLAVKIAARILMIPVIAGASYEVIRAAGRNDRSMFFRLVSLPGLALQKITTRPPSHDQIEVAIKAMEGVIARVPSTAEEESRARVVEMKPVIAPGEVLAPEPGTAGIDPG